MASRTILMGLQSYDRDGGLDWFCHGSEWREWREWRLKEVNAETLKEELRAKFERLLTAAFHDCDAERLVEEASEPYEWEQAWEQSAATDAAKRMKEIEGE